MKTSNFLSWNTADFIKGFVIAILVPVFTVIQQSLNAGVLVLDWKAISIAAIAGCVAYLTKNLFTNSNGELLKKE